VTLHYDDAQIEIHKLVVGPVENNVFVLRDKSTGEAVLLDAANEHDKLLPLAERLNVRRVLETHGHWDHIQAIPEMREAGYEVAVTALDAPRLKEVGYDVFLEPETVIEVGRTRLHTILTPGHTEGSMCFLVEGSPILFSGDTLFPGGPGNTSFEGGDFPTIIRSIDSRLLTLPADTHVLPGHGLDTTVGAERPHLQEWIDRGW
jgi:glyoxylase-like metal-dependent hydrolase (beta-lactamase superfamily II)